jgi:hypothetical protein
MNINFSFCYFYVALYIFFIFFLCIFFYIFFIFYFYISFLLVFTAIKLNIQHKETTKLLIIVKGMDRDDI